MRVAKRALASVLALLMVFMLLPQMAWAADTHDVSDAEELAAALSAAASGDTIMLGDDIDYNTTAGNVETIIPIKIEGKTVTFDLNGYNLNVTNSVGHGLEVGAGGVVNVTGIDEENDNGFSTTSSEPFSAGVYAHDGGKATVSYASGTYGVVAGGIDGDEGTGEVTVLDGVWGAMLGVMATGAGSNVTVNGDVQAGDEGDRPAIAMGVVVSAGGAVTINGDLEVYASNSAMGVVVHDATASAPATVHLNGMVYVEDTEKVNPYIKWGDGIPVGEGESDGEYMRYTDPSGYGKVYIIGACAIGDTVYSAFSDAWSVASRAPDGSSTTIRLLRNVEQDGGVVVANKTVVFDLNGHTLDVTNSEGNALEVGAGGVVDITDSAAGEGYSSFYTNSYNNYGVYAHDGGRATVTNAGGRLGGVLAESGSSVHVKGRARGVNAGVAASGGSTVTVDDYIDVSGYGMPYILLGGTAKSASDGVPGASPYETYLVYSDDNDNIVREKTDAVCKLSLTIPHDEETFVTLHASLGSALDATEHTLDGWKATITLFTDIEYDTGILITKGNLTFNLNGHTLAVKNDDGDGLSVGEGGVVDITGDGAFNVTGSGCGVRACNGGQATVTNITVPGGGIYIRLGTDSSPRDFTPDQGTPGAGDYAGYLAYTDGTNHVYVKAPVVGTAPSITTTSLPDGTVGTAYSQTLSATGDTPITWSMAGGSDPLPGGLTLSSDGVISGTPTAAGTFNFTVKAENGTSPDATKALSITISPATPAGTAPSITTTTLPDGTVGTAYSQTLSATGDTPITWSAAGGSDPLPGGLTLSSGGVISGTPTAAGTFNFTVKAENGTSPDATKALSITISPAPTYSLTITAGAGGSITTGTSGSYAQGAVITIAASANTNYSFNKWTSAGGGSFANANSASTTFTMPAGTVTITAGFTYNGGGGGSGGSGGGGGGSGSGGGTPPTPTYNADVEGGGKMPVIVNTGTGNATVNLGIVAGNLSDGGSTTVTVPSTPGVSSYTANLPASSLSGSNGEGTLTLDTSLGSVTIPGNMLTGTGLTGDAGITIGVADKENLPDEVKAALGDRPIIQITLTVNGRQTSWSNDSAPVTVSVPYSPTAEELANPEHIVVWYIDGSGNAVSVPNGRYNSETGTVTFSTTHFSRYAVAYVHKTFGDLGAVEWARKPIEVMASKGIISGTSATTYSPSANITRADYLVLLIKTLGLTADFEDNFDDVQSGAYYYEAAGIAKKLGITGGIGNNCFNPQDPISRQDMMVMTARALEHFKGLKSTADLPILDQFTDKGGIAGYAMKSLATLVKEGLIAGSGEKLNPRAQTTRAEAAVFLYRIYNTF